MATARHPLLLSLRWLLPAAALLALGLGVLARSPLGHIAGFAIAFVILVLAVVQSRLQPVLILDDAGYAIQQGSKILFRVAWSEVKKVRADAREQALYIDCGDPSRNLLVPPARGYGFRFADTPKIYARVLATVGDRVVQVERLDEDKGASDQTTDDKPNGPSDDKPTNHEPTPKS
jgi:hypothetical protein